MFVHGFACLDSIEGWDVCWGWVEIGLTQCPLVPKIANYLLTQPKNKRQRSFFTWSIVSRCSQSYIWWFLQFNIKVDFFTFLICWLCFPRLQIGHHDARTKEWTWPTGTLNKGDGKPVELIPEGWVIKPDWLRVGLSWKKAEPCLVWMSGLVWCWLVQSGSRANFGWLWAGAWQQHDMRRRHGQQSGVTQPICTSAMPAGIGLWQ